MKTHACISSSRISGLALVAGLVWLPLATPAHAQWLVQDNNLYELIKNEVVDDQLKNINKKLQKHLDRIDTSGKNVAPYSPQINNLNDNSSTFNELQFPLSPNTLLDPSKHEDNAKTFESSAKTYIGEEVLPNCNKEEETKRPVLYKNCVYARNIMGEQLRALRTISQTLEARNRKLHALMQNNEYKTTGELQRKQYEISALQAMMVNDNMRLQTTLAAFNTTRDMYQMRYTEALQGKLSQKGEPTAAQKAGRAALLLALGIGAEADSDKPLKEKSSLAGSKVEQLLQKGLTHLSK